MKLITVSSIAFSTPEVQVVKKATAPYSTEIDPVNGRLTVHSIIPKGIEIQNGIYGKKLVATQDFHEGQVLYIGYANLVDVSLGSDQYCVRLYNHDGSLQAEETLDTVHSVVDYDKLSNEEQDRIDASGLPVPSIRQIYGFDAFMNHSCDANTYHPLVSRSTEMMSYQAIAIRDIFPGDEITCDYAFFDYECNGHEIESCLCGSSNCRGKMMGFRGLALEEKINILHYCEAEIIRTFFKENPDIVLLKSQIPSGIDLVVKGNDRNLVASRTFEPNEVVFVNKANLISPQDLDTKTYVLECGGKYFLMDNLHHFIHRSEYSEAVGFDSFMDHSCCPNTSQVYEDSTTYVVRASHLIQPGDRITMDYTTLDSLEKVTFQCNCASTVCKGLIFS